MKINFLQEGEAGKEGEDKSGSSSSSGEENDEEDEISKNLNKAMKMEYEFFKKQMKSWQKDPLTLSHILNILDGLLECHGRILVCEKYFRVEGDVEKGLRVQSTYRFSDYHYQSP